VQSTKVLREPIQTTENEGVKKIFCTSRSLISRYTPLSTASPVAIPV